MSDLQSRVLQLEQKVTQLEASLTLASAGNLRGAVTPKRKPVENSRSSIASGSEISTQDSVDTLYAGDVGHTKPDALDQPVLDLSEQASIQGSVSNLQSRRAVDRWVQNLDQTSSQHTGAPSNASRAPSIANFDDRLERMSIWSQSSHDTLRSLTGSRSVGFEVEFSWRRYRKAMKLMDLRQFQPAIPHLEKTLEVIEKLKQAVNADFVNVTDTQSRLIDAFSDPTFRSNAVSSLARALLETGSDHSRAQDLLLEMMNDESNRSGLKNDANAYLLAVLFLMQPTPDPTAARSICLAALDEKSLTMEIASQRTQKLLALLVACCFIAGDSDAEIWEELLTEGIEWHGAFGTEIYTADLAHRFWCLVTNQLPVDQAQSLIWSALQSGYEWIATSKSLCKSCFRDSLYSRHPTHGPFVEDCTSKPCSDTEAHADMLAVHARTHMTIAYLSGCRRRSGPNRECIPELELIMHILASEASNMTYDYSAAFGYALLAQNTQTMRFLESKNISSNDISKVFDLALKQGKIQALKELVSGRYAKSLALDSAGNTVLHRALQYPEIVESIIEGSPALVNYSNYQGYYPLDTAADVNLASAVLLAKKNASYASTNFWDKVGQRSSQHADVPPAIELAKLLMTTNRMLPKSYLDTVPNLMFKKYLKENHARCFY